jgi:predicted dithiol-disulfide oxidoreductase (DUF899 family)
MYAITAIPGEGERAADGVRVRVLDHVVVSHEEWLVARRALFAKEQELMRLQAQVSRARRDLPWERIETCYRFVGAEGEETLAELFGAHSELIVYHLAYDPSWEIGFKHGSFWAQDVTDLAERLRGRDASLVAVSSAPLAKLQAHLGRTGRRFKWVSSLGTEFGRDFGTTFDQTGIEGWDHEGVSVFHKDGSGNVYHTYSAYASATT